MGTFSKLTRISATSVCQKAQEVRRDFFAYGDSSATSRKARVLHRNYRYNDAELEKLLEQNPELPYEPAADVHNIVSGSKGKALDNFKHWM